MSKLAGGFIGFGVGFLASVTFIATVDGALEGRTDPEDFNYATGIIFLITIVLTALVGAIVGTLFIAARQNSPSNAVPLCTPIANQNAWPSIPEAIEAETPKLSPNRALEATSITFGALSILFWGLWFLNGTDGHSTIGFYTFVFPASFGACAAGAASWRIRRAWVGIIVGLVSVGLIAYGYAITMLQVSQHPNLFGH